MLGNWCRQMVILPHLLKAEGNLMMHVPPQTQPVSPLGVAPLLRAKCLTLPSDDTGRFLSTLLYPSHGKRHWIIFLDVLHSLSNAQCTLSVRPAGASNAGERLSQCSTRKTFSSRSSLWERVRGNTRGHKSTPHPMVSPAGIGSTARALWIAALSTIPTIP